LKHEVDTSITVLILRDSDAEENKRSNQLESIAHSDSGAYAAHGWSTTTPDLFVFNTDSVHQ
jgi:hypothetical protein